MISEVPHVDLFLPWLYTVYVESQSKNAQKVPENVEITKLPTSVGFKIFHIA